MRRMHTAQMMLKCPLYAPIQIISRADCRLDCVAGNSTVARLRRRFDGKRSRPSPRSGSLCGHNPNRSAFFCIRVRRRFVNVNMVANTVGIQMPADFPLAAYNDIHAHIAPLQPRFPDAYRHNGGAWNAVAIRFRSAAEADDVFQSSLSDPSSVEQRFRQEVALFQFFTNSVSVLDSCA